MSPHAMWPTHGRAHHNNSPEMWIQMKNSLITSMQMSRSWTKFDQINWSIQRNWWCVESLISNSMQNQITPTCTHTFTTHHINPYVLQHNLTFSKGVVNWFLTLEPHTHKITCIQLWTMKRLTVIAVLVLLLANSELPQAFMNWPTHLHLGDDPRKWTTRMPHQMKQKVAIIDDKTHGYGSLGHTKLDLQNRQRINRFLQDFYGSVGAVFMQSKDGSRMWMISKEKIQDGLNL